MTPVVRQVVLNVVAIGAGLAMVQGLTAQLGPVPAWLGYLCGTTVTLASLAQLRVRVQLRQPDDATEAETDDR